MAPSDKNERSQHILNAAIALVLRQGFGKTTMSDIAEEAGVSRGVVYLHFPSKDDLFGALVRREMQAYGEAWLEHIESDPRGGTIGGLFRAVLFAINSRPFMAAVMRRDRRVLGGYLRKPGNPLASSQAGSLWPDTIRAMQRAGAVRTDLDPDMTAHILDIISYGLLTVGEFKEPDQLPPYEATMEAIADMMDRLLTPADGGNVEAGKALIKKLSEVSRARFEQNREDRDHKEEG